MEKAHELEVTVIEEAGYQSAIAGLGLNKNQQFHHIQENVAPKLAFMDFGHNKFLEHIYIWTMTRAPRYWWQEADTFRLSSKNSQSTMHTILKNKLEFNNFECNEINPEYLTYLNLLLTNKELVLLKRSLPEGFMQTRMWMFSYKTLRNIIIQRAKHRLPHWQTFLKRIWNQIKHPELLPFKLLNE